MKKYQILITQIEEKTATKHGEFTIIDTRPWRPDELKECSRSIYGSEKEFLDRNPLKEVRGYAPDVPTVEIKSTELLRQTVEDLDLPAVIKAINRL